MKAAMQALLIAGEKMMGDVIMGKKTITIRAGHRDYTPGAKLMLGCHILNWARVAGITDVKHTTLKEVSPRDLFDDGYYDVESAVEDLKKYYPDITKDSDVTVIRWELRG